MKKLIVFVLCALILVPCIIATEAEIDKTQKAEVTVEIVENKSQQEVICADVEIDKHEVERNKVINVISQNNPELTTEQVEGYADNIVKLSQDYELEPMLITSVMYQESRFDPNAISCCGAIGLMQVMPSTGKIFGYSRGDLFIPEHNMRAGTAYLKYLHDLYNGNSTKAISAYCHGPGNVSRGNYNLQYYHSVKRHFNEFKDVEGGADYE